MIFIKEHIMYFIRYSLKKLNKHFTNLTWKAIEFLLDIIKFIPGNTKGWRPEGNEDSNIRVNCCFLTYYQMKQESKFISTKTLKRSLRSSCLSFYSFF